MTDFAAGIPSNAHTPPGAVAFSATAMAVNCALSNVFTTVLTARSRSTMNCSSSS